MPGAGGTTERRFRKSFLVGLLAAGLGGAACVGVTIEPVDPDWVVVSGPDDAPQAIWTAGDVDIVVPLRYAGDATHVTAEVRNYGRESARLTVAAPGGSSALFPLGTASSGPDASELTVSESVFPGRPVEVPAGLLGAPGTVHLSLLPDDKWGPDDAPALGSRVTFDVDIETGAEDVPCRFRFRVVGSPEQGWYGMDTTSRVLVLLLLAGASTAAVYWVD